MTGMALYLSNQIIQDELKEEEIYKLFPQYKEEIQDILSKNNYYIGLIPDEK